MINYKAVINYKTAMTLFKQCFKKRIIDADDLRAASTFFARKYGLPSNSIFIENDLLFMRK